MTDLRKEAWKNADEDALVDEANAMGKHANRPESPDGCDPVAAYWKERAKAAESELARLRGDLGMAHDAMVAAGRVIVDVTRGWGYGGRSLGVEEAGRAQSGAGRSHRRKSSGARRARTG